MRCPYGKSEIEAEAQYLCPSCRTPHHRECWGENRAARFMRVHRRHWKRDSYGGEVDAIALYDLTLRREAAHYKEEALKRVACKAMRTQEQTEKMTR